MATTYGMTPMMSTTMPNPTTTTTSTPMMSQSQPMGSARNMNLPLSMARPISVTEFTPNLEQIQNFPVVGTSIDGTHFHQNPTTGQMYRMTDETHKILSERLSQIVNSEYTPNDTSVTFFDYKKEPFKIYDFYKNSFEMNNESFDNSISTNTIDNQINFVQNNNLQNQEMTVVQNNNLQNQEMTVVQNNNLQNQEMTVVQNNNLQQFVQSSNINTFTPPTQESTNTFVRYINQFGNFSNMTSIQPIISTSKILTNDFSRNYVLGINNIDTNYRNNVIINIFSKF
jgi:hypothetical protein